MAASKTKTSVPLSSVAIARAAPRPMIATSISLYQFYRRGLTSIDVNVVIMLLIRIDLFERH